MKKVYLHQLGKIFIVGAFMCNLWGCSNNTPTLNTPIDCYTYIYKGDLGKYNEIKVRITRDDHFSYKLYKKDIWLDTLTTENQMYKCRIENLVVYFKDTHNILATFSKDYITITINQEIIGSFENMTIRAWTTQ